MLYQIQTTHLLYLAVAFECGSLVLLPSFNRGGVTRQVIEVI